MLSKFKDYLLINGNSFNTAQNYVQRIEKLLREISIDNLSEDTINNYLRILQQKVSPSTFNGYIFAFKAFLIFLKKDIILPKVSRPIQTLPESFDEKYFEEEIIPTLEQITKTDFLKFRAIFYFLFYSGIRIGEINKIKRDDFDLKLNRVKVLMPKTKRERIVFFTDKTNEHIKEYFDSEPEEINAFNITSNSIKQRMKEYKQYFPNINLHCHLFRHAFAMNLLKKGIDLFSVSQLLGHKDIKTTTRYLGLTVDNLQEIYNKKMNK